jgi:hypothetical protein
MRVFNTHRTIQSGDEKAWGENVLSGINVPTRQLPFSRFYNSYKVTNKSINIRNQTYDKTLTTGIIQVLVIMKVKQDKGCGSVRRIPAEAKNLL